MTAYNVTILTVVYKRTKYMYIFCVIFKQHLGAFSICPDYDV